MASHIMPMDTIIVEVIQDGQTVLGSSTLLQFTIVWLRLIDAT
jgi:hypothetical protein